jgi:polysaccharide export outer membrane protein
VDALKRETKEGCLRPQGEGTLLLFAGASLLLGVLSTMTACTMHRARDSESFTHVDSTKTSNEDFNATIAGIAANEADLEYRIGAEDLLKVTLFDIEAGDGDPQEIMVRVASTGDVTLPYVGTVQAANITPLELEQRLIKVYRKYIRDPQIAVLVEEYQSFRVSVVGYVNEPGVLELRGRKTVLEAIAMTGGLTEVAGKSVRLTRRGTEKTESVLIDLDAIAEGLNPDANMVLLPGDVVSVPKAGMFYVEGVVANPGAYPLLDDTTVSEAVATAGGPDRTLANASGTLLYRKREDGKREAISVNLASLKNGGSEDFYVQENDVIVVPVSGPALFLDRVTAGILRIGFNSNF